MIAIKWEFEGDDVDVAAAQSALERVLSRYRRALGGIWCPVHGSGPSLIVRGQTLGDLDFSLEPCCQELIDEVIGRVHGMRRRRVASHADRSSRTERPERRRAVRRNEPA